MFNFLKALKSSYTIAGLILVLSVGLLLYINNFFNIRHLGENNVTELFFVDNISHAHDFLIERFNTEYAGSIKIVPVNLPFTKFSTNERKELLARALRSKSDRIDIFSVDVIWVPRFARWSQPLDMYFTANERNHILPHALTSCYHDDNLVALPFYIDIGMMYYRRDLLQNFPQLDSLENRLKKSITWEEFLDLNRNNPHPDNPFYLFAARNFEGLICSFMELYMSHNQSIFVADSVQLNTPAAREALTFLVDLVNRYDATPPVVTRFDEVQVYEYAMAHDALFFRGWPGFTRHYASAYGPKLDAVKPAALPHFADQPPQATFGGWNLMVSKFSTNKHAAVEFLKFIHRPENQKILFNKGGYIPILNSIYDDQAFMAEHPDLEYYRELLDHGVHRPFHVNYTKISDVLSYYIYLAIKQEISVDEALLQATHEINSEKVMIR